MERKLEPGGFYDRLNGGIRFKGLVLNSCKSGDEEGEGWSRWLKGKARAST
jgi:hypothetical protein